MRLIYLLERCICSLFAFFLIVIFRQDISILVDLPLIFGFVGWSIFNGPPDVVNVCLLAKKESLSVGSLGRWVWLVVYRPDIKVNRMCAE